MKCFLFFLLFNLTAFAQFQTPSSYDLCDDNNDQFATFDLTTKIPEILGGENPTNYTVVFYSSLADAQNNGNPIGNPNLYTNTQPAIQTLGVKIVNNTTTVASFVTLDIRVLPLPIANPSELSFCDPTELPLYVLEDAIPQITNYNPSVVVTFYETLSDAQTGTNPLPPSGYVPLISPGVQTLYAKVENSLTSCSSITTLTLHTQDCNTTCLAPTNLTVSSITDTTVSIGWTDSGGNTLWEILLLPISAPTPTSSTSGTFLSQTNPFVVTGLNPNTCFSVYIRTVCQVSATPMSTWTGPITFCTYDCINTGQCPDKLTLIAFLDANNNGIKDTGDTAFNHGTFEYEINNSGSTLYGYPNYGNFYIFQSDPANTYNLNFVIDSNFTPFFSSTASYTNITLPVGSGTNTYYFPVTELQPLNDLEIQLVSNGNPRPGFTYYNTIVYKNNGSQTVNSGTVTFTKDPAVSITDISQSGTTATATGFEYTFSNLAPNEIRFMNVDMQVPTIPTVNLGEFLTNSITINPSTGDAFPLNNSSHLTQVIVGSYDPNDKTESHGGKIVFDDFTPNEYLYYTIRFENTGTANAEFIRVNDALNAQLNENTFEMLSASHLVNTRRNGNQLMWHFYNINLPPTATHPNESHGYVSFRIKPKTGYSIGDIIPNTAEIYFDYNPAIVTNTCNTEFVENLSTNEFNQTTIHLYPNPTNDRFTLHNFGTETIDQISIYEISGKKIFHQTKSFETQTLIPVSNFTKGIYLVEITFKNNLKVTKKLIVK